MTPTVTDIPNEYGGGFTRITDDGRRDPWADAERAAQKAHELKRPEAIRHLAKQTGHTWTDEMFDAALACEGRLAFPASQKRARFLAWGWDLVWLDSELDAWLDKVRAHTQLLQSLVGTGRR